MGYNKAIVELAMPQIFIVATSLVGLLHSIDQLRLLAYVYSLRCNCDRRFYHRSFAGNSGARHHLPFWHLIWPASIGPHNRPGFGDGNNDRAPDNFVHGRSMTRTTAPTERFFDKNLPGLAFME